MTHDHTSRARHRAAVVTLVGALAAGLAACGGGSSDPLAKQEPSQGGGSAAAGTIVVGSADFSESQLLAHIYQGALKAKGVSVGEPKLNIGARETYLKGMSDGSINVIPEYTGALAQFYDPQFAAKEPDQVYEQLKTKLPADLTVLAKSAAEDKDAIAVKKETVDRYKLTSLEDLAPVAKDLTLGAPPEFKTRAQGVPGLEQQYGITFKDMRSLKGQALVQALKNDQVQAANVFTTDPAIATNGFVVLQDPKRLFGSQNVVPLVSKKVATPQVTEALNDVSAKLTTDGLQTMLAQVDGQKKDPAAVAQEFLTANGLA